MKKINLFLIIIVAICVALTVVLLYDMFSDKRWEKTREPETVGSIFG